MPRLSQFYGISIEMYWDDHNPPHFHASYAEYDASIRLADLGVAEGWLPGRVMALVREWAALHGAELAAAWESCHNQRAPEKIAPLP